MRALFTGLIVAFALYAIWSIDWVVRFTNSIPTADDAEEAHAICDAVNASVAFQHNADAAWRPGRRHSTIYVDGVHETVAQDRVVDVVRATREHLHAKPVEIKFRDAGAVLRTVRVE